jgi:hypothetical protein
VNLETGKSSRPFPVAALPVSLAYLSEFYYHPPELRQSVKYGQNMLKYAKKRVK